MTIHAELDQIGLRWLRHYILVTGHVPVDWSRRTVEREAIAGQSDGQHQEKLPNRL
jgi:hypothetical protein